MDETEYDASHVVLEKKGTPDDDEKLASEDFEEARSFGSDLITHLVDAATSGDLQLRERALKSLAEDYYILKVVSDEPELSKPFVDAILSKLTQYLGTQNMDTPQYRSNEDPNLSPEQIGKKIIQNFLLLNTDSLAGEQGKAVGLQQLLFLRDQAEDLRKNNSLNVDLGLINGLKRDMKWLNLEF